jgi:hypothetical protein
MISATELLNRMHAVPFKPFRITMSSGKAYDVPNHDAMFVKRNSVIIGINLDDQSLAEFSVECSLLHITSVSDIVVKKQKPRKKAA